MVRVQGGDPTASAILGDVVMAARNKALLGRGPLLSDYANFPVLDIGEVKSRFFIALSVADKPGVLSRISAIFAQNDISIATVYQQAQEVDFTSVSDNSDIHSGSTARLILTTHAAQDSVIRSILAEVAESEYVHQVTTVLRLEF